ncbi:MAG: NADP oxidoreductase, partial [bacterium]|nr:NADP oxidoreductase [bacterium]
GVFGFVGRGMDKRVAVNSESKLGETNADAEDRAVSACPVGALMKKRVGYAVPIGKRTYDEKPIGTDVEQGSEA